MKAFIFDMDGTLLATNELWWRLPEMLLRKEGITCPAELAKDLGMQPCGIMTEKLISQGVLPYTNEQVWPVYFEMLRELYAQEAQWRPGAEAFLKLLQNAGIPCCVATATPIKPATIALSHCGAVPYFRFIQSVHTINLRKDDPRFFEAIADQLETPIGDCIVVEDAVHAVRGAKQAGATVWAIADRLMAPHWPEIQAIADASFDTYAEMAQAFMAERI